MEVLLFDPDVHKASKHPASTSVMSMRPAMLRRVRGEKWGVIMTRRLASEKENWWGCRLINSSTITTGESWPPAFWPERDVILYNAQALSMIHTAPPSTHTHLSSRGSWRCHSVGLPLLPTHLCADCSPNTADLEYQTSAPPNPKSDC